MEKLAFLLYLFTLVFSPLAFGTIDLWALFLVEGCCFLALACYLFTILRSGQPYIKVPGLVPLLLFLLWTAIQLVPLPQSLVAFISPATAALYAPLLTTSQTENVFIPLSVHPFYTIQDLFRFSAYAACYFLSVQLLHDPKRMRQTLKLVLTLAAGISFYAIIQHYTGNDRIFWFRTFTHKPVAGTFAYKNHFAAYVELLMPLALSLYFYYRPRWQPTVSPVQMFINLCNRAADHQHLPFVLATCLMALSLLLSESRGGVFCAFSSVLLLLILGRKRFKLNLTWSITLGLIFLVATGVGKDGLISIDQRFATLSRDGATLNGRLDFWKDALHIISDFSLTGTGAGTFRTIYPRYQHNPNGALPLHAHNDYLETQTNGGLIASLSVLAFLVLFFRSTFKSYFKRKDGYVVHLYLGSLAGLMALLLHCLIDLQFRVTASVGLYFFFVLGVNAACVTLKQHRNSARTLNLNHFSGLRGWCAFGSLSLFTLFCLFIQIGELRALALFPEIAKAEKRMGKAGYDTKSDLLALESYAVSNNFDAEKKQEMCDHATHASNASPLNPRYRFIHSLCTDSQDAIDNALRDGRAALRLNPVQAVYFQHYGELLEKKGEEATAKPFMLAAIANDPSELQFHRSYINFLLRIGKTEEALQQVTTSLAIQPEKAPIILADLEAAKLTPADVEASLPHRVAPRLALAAWLEKTGKIDKASQAYDLALEYLENEKQMSSSFFWQLLRFYQQQKNEEKALVILQQAVLHLPKDFGFRVQLGDLYSRQGMYRKALEEYRMALQLQPGNQQAQQRLDLATGNLGI